VVFAGDAVNAAHGIALGRRGWDCLCTVVINDERLLTLHIDGHVGDILAISYAHVRPFKGDSCPHRVSPFADHSITSFSLAVGFSPS